MSATATWGPDVGNLLPFLSVPCPARLAWRLACRILALAVALALDSSKG